MDSITCRCARRHTNLLVYTKSEECTQRRVVPFASVTDRANTLCPVQWRTVFYATELRRGLFHVHQSHTPHGTHLHHCSAKLGIECLDDLLADRIDLAHAVHGDELAALLVDVEHRRGLLVVGVQTVLDRLRGVVGTPLLLRALGHALKQHIGGAVSATTASSCSPRTSRISSSALTWATLRG